MRIATYDDVRPGRKRDEPCDERIVIRFPASVKEDLEELAERQNCSVASAIRASVNKMLQGKR